MRDFNIFFQKAIEDLIFLLDRQYPKKSAIELVGNRYRLDSEERMVLYRGVFDTESMRERRKKQVDTPVTGRVLVDGYNVLITIESYLKGKLVFRSLDTFVRDVSGMYGNHAFSDFTKRSIELIIQFMKQGVSVRRMNNRPEAARTTSVNTDICTPDSVRPDSVYLDYPVSKSGELAASMREIFESEGLNVEVTVVKSPDTIIIEESRAGGPVVVASSDTVILDRIEKGVDIPAYIIERVFHKELFDLNVIRNG
ncbi:MAG: hypothetical protein AMS17_07925 [Spirochaetes bacterium DG_61]|nr:MAG: hypothetical protein AMS17_07925 [Spirochaetes bacterium DG_61]